MQVLTKAAPPLPLENVPHKTIRCLHCGTVFDLVREFVEHHQRRGAELTDCQMRQQGDR